MPQIAGALAKPAVLLLMLATLTFLFAHTITLPVYIMFLILGSRLYEPLTQAFIFLAQLNYSQISVDRIETLRKTPVLTGVNPAGKPERFDIQPARILNHAKQYPLA